MAKFRNILGFLYASFALVLVALMAARFAIVGLIGSLLIVFGLLGLIFEGEKIVDRLIKELSSPSLSREMRTRRSKLTSALGVLLPEYATVSLRREVEGQSKRAIALDERWEEIVERDPTIRTEEADNVVRFEEAFLGYLDEMAELAYSTSFVGNLTVRLQEGSKILLEFEQYLLGLAVRVEMGD